MVYSRRFNYYKFPGGGIEQDETNIESLIREVKEEAGLIVKEDSVKEYGYVRRIEKNTNKNVLLQDNYYYICEVEDEKVEQSLENYEDYEKFTLKYVDHQEAIYTNRFDDHGNKSETMIEREALVLEMLIKEGVVF